MGAALTDAPDLNAAISRTERALRAMRKARKAAQKKARPPKLPKRLPDAAKAEAGAGGATRQREPRQLDPAYLGWIRTLPCVACTVLNVQQKTPTEAAHPKHGEAGAWREFGAAERSHDRMAVPLCSAHHRGRGGEHDSGQRQFWDGIGVRLPELVRALNDCRADAGDGAAVIHQFRRKAA